MATEIVTTNELQRALELKSGELRIDHRIVAKGLGFVNTAKKNPATQWRRNVLEKYQEQLEQLGVLSKDTLDDGTIVWYLTEDQVRLAVHKSRNGLSGEAIKAIKQHGIDLSEFIAIPRKRAKKTERHYSNDLAKNLGGLREVKTIAGNIDVLTPAEIIEVKSVQSWKSAIGQVLAYKYYYPSHQARIHLYGETQESFLEMIQSHCFRLGVTMTWEP